MSELELKRKTIAINLYGEKHSLKYPSLAEMEAYDDDIVGKKPNEVVKCAVKFLANLGMPEDVVKGMDYDDFIAVMAHIRTPKKKS